MLAMADDVEADMRGIFSDICHAGGGGEARLWHGVDVIGAARQSQRSNDLLPATIPEPGGWFPDAVRTTRANQRRDA